MDNKKKVKYVISLIQFDDGSIGTFDESPDGKMDAVQWVGLLAAALLGSTTFNRAEAKQAAPGESSGDMEVG